MSREFTAGELRVRVFDDVQELARGRGHRRRHAMRAAVAERGDANVMLATGNSQLAFLSELVHVSDVDWSRVTAFHMDEYVGLPPSHSASFQRYMRERVAAGIPFKEFHYLTGDTGDAAAEGKRYARAAPRPPARPVLLRDRGERAPRVQRSAGRRLRRSRAT